MTALALALALAANPQQPAPPKANTNPQQPALPKANADPQPSAQKANAEAFVAAMSRGEFDAAMRDLDANIAKQINADKVRELWDTVIRQVGAFEKVTGSRTEPSGEHVIVAVGVKFAKSAVDFRMTMDKAGKIAGIRIASAPVPYAPPDYVNADTFVEDAVVVGKGTPYELPGTLSKPKAASPTARVAAVVLVHGSGPHDRDETIRGNRPFKDLAWGLASRGVAVLRYDKRTMVHGARVVKEPMTIDAEVTDDARAAVALLRKTPGVDPAKVFVLGHSLGGMMAPRIASLEPGLAGFIVMAGGTRPLEDIIVEQFEYITSLSKTPEAQAELAKVKEQVARVKNPGLRPETPAADLPLNTPASYWLSLRGYAPAEIASKLTCRMLILHGDRDYQVSAADFGGWEGQLFSKPSATLKRFPNLNHLFMAGKGKATPMEYEQSGHVAKEVIEVIANWVR
jgi:pimeloyl-ACP methyl ester carboxylesterase